MGTQYLNLTVAHSFFVVVDNKNSSRRWYELSCLQPQGHSINISSFTWQFYKTSQQVFLEIASVRTLSWKGIEFGNLILISAIHYWNPSIENSLSSYVLFIIPALSIWQLKQLLWCVGRINFEHSIMHPSWRPAVQNIYIVKSRK